MQGTLCRQRVRYKTAFSPSAVMRCALGQKSVNAFAAIGVMQVAHKVVTLGVQLLA